MSTASGKRKVKKGLGLTGDGLVEMGADEDYVEAVMDFIGRAIDAVIEDLEEETVDEDEEDEDEDE